MATPSCSPTCAPRASSRSLDFAEQVTKVDLRDGAVGSARGAIPEAVASTGQRQESGDTNPANTPPRLPPLVAEGRGSDLWAAIRQSLAADSPGGDRALYRRPAHGQGRRPGRRPRGQGARRAAARRRRGRSQPAAESEARQRPTSARRSGRTSRSRSMRRSRPKGSTPAKSASSWSSSASATTTRPSAAARSCRRCRSRAQAGRAAAGPVLAHAPRSGPLRLFRPRRAASKTSCAKKTTSSSAPWSRSSAASGSACCSSPGPRRGNIAWCKSCLSRDKTIVVSCWLQTLDEERAQEGTRQITRLPITKEELFYYDVILMFDPNPQEFDQAWIELLKQFVGEHSGGLLFMAGPKHSGRLLDERPHGGAWPRSCRSASATSGRSKWPRCSRPTSGPGR